MQESKINSGNFVAFIQEIINELDVIYLRNDLSREDKLIKKDQIIDAAKERFDAEYENLFTNENYRWFSQLVINNAYLELFRLYYTDDNFFEDLYEKSGRNLPVLVAAAKTITKKGNPRTQLENALIR